MNSDKTMNEWRKTIICKCKDAAYRNNIMKRNVKNLKIKASKAVIKEV